MAVLTVDTGHGGRNVIVTFDNGEQVTLDEAASARAREIGGDDETALREYIAGLA